MAINKYFSIISQGDAPGKRGVPGGGLAIMESYSQWGKYQKAVGRWSKGCYRGKFVLSTVVVGRKPAPPATA